MAKALNSAFVVGYTGATGKALVKELASSKRFEKVVLIGRRKVEYEAPELQAFVCLCYSDRLLCARVGCGCWSLVYEVLVELSENWPVLDE